MTYGKGVPSVESVGVDLHSVQVDLNFVQFVEKDAPHSWVDLPMQYLHFLLKT